MPTINANKVGLGSVSNQTSHSNARNATSGLATTGPTGTQNGALYSAVLFWEKSSLQYFKNFPFI